MVLVLASIFHSKNKQHSRYIFIRVDGDDSIGLGHVVRCISIAETFDKQLNKVIFLCRSLSRNARSRITRSGFLIINLSDTFDANFTIEKIIETSQCLKSSKVLIDLPFNFSLELDQYFVRLVFGLNDQELPLALIDGLDEDCAAMHTELPISLLIVPYLNAEKRTFLVRKHTKVFAGASFSTS